MDQLHENAALPSTLRTRNSKALAGVMILYRCRRWVRFHILRAVGFGLLWIGNAGAAEIPQGAHLLLRMENSISTRTAQEGDFVYLRTASPVAVEGQIAVPAGSYVQGVVTQSKRSGRVKGRAELAIRLETLTLASGKSFEFAPHLAAVESGETGQKVVGKEGAIQQSNDYSKTPSALRFWPAAARLSGA